MNCASNPASRIFWMLVMRESPKEQMPLLSKALAILREPQTPFVTAVMQIPLEPYNVVSLRRYVPVYRVLSLSEVLASHSLVLKLSLLIAL